MGLFTRLASIPLLITMVVAIATAKRAEISGLPDLLGLVEFLYVVLLLWLAAGGPGPLSADRMLARLSRWPEQPAGRLAVSGER